MHDEAELKLNSCKAECFLDKSEKFGRKQDQYIARSNRYVFFRVVKRGKDFYGVMTATAPEDGTRYEVFPDPQLLADATDEVVKEFDDEVAIKFDREQRGYVEFEVSCSQEMLLKLLDHILHRVEQHAALA
jgi:hypothetical protein